MMIEDRKEYIAALERLMPGRVPVVGGDLSIDWGYSGIPESERPTQAQIEGALKEVRKLKLIEACKEETKAKIVDKKNVGPLESQATGAAALGLMFDRRLRTIEGKLGIKPDISAKNASNLDKLALLLDLHAGGKAEQKKIKNG